ncbi:hypothetical protein [Lysinibacillus fusiformis]|uniref:Uncharacterized protein n=1 Tax=Lysinibacillus fusiformis TaxID=28031 RepID=A0A1H8YWH5_9BACI|nr:hypothetical protein [Lysinibacillus fusiformis]SCX95103.1 hypothetical protein SAMN02787081_00731 [Lysinibacillus fusiformis]SEM93644.1 hypothetical protein SAMN02787103_00732 [Lysinibacillus fusiformis]SEP56554.1 hypothetical protein SAMN02787113_00027 [Lysinibacillus fusiformis]
MEHAKIEQSYQDYRALGYSEELLPKGPQERDWVSLTTSQFGWVQFTILCLI